MKSMSTNNEQKKTNYPNLERLPDTSFFPHLLNWVWNKPRWIVEELYEKHFLATKRELQEKKLELIMLKYKVEQLELMNKVQKTIDEADNVTNLFEERSNK